jgi:hypothetical protein
MNRSILIALVLTLSCAFGVRVYSQGFGGPRNTLQQLQQMKAVNEKILEQQTALLLQLEELHKEATQTKIFSKRG